MTNIAKAEVSDIEKLNGIKIIEHFNCRLHIKPQSIEGSLKNRLTSELEKKGFKVSEYEQGKKVVPGEFIATLKKELLGSGYKECLIQLEIQKILGEYPSINDQSIYKQTKTRKFPRQTFDGQERCELALRDLFFSLSICRVK